MPLLIDGHNLIGQMPDIGLDDPDDEAKLTARLKTYCARTGKRMTVVFDGGLPGGRSPLSGGGVEVIFAPLGHPADGILEERIRHATDPAGLTVVTSDREIIAVAEMYGVRVLRSEEFAPRLAPPRRHTRPIGTGTTGTEEDVRLSPKEIEEWLRLFGVKE